MATIDEYLQQAAAMNAATDESVDRLLEQARQITSPEAGLSNKAQEKQQKLSTLAGTKRVELAGVNKIDPATVNQFIVENPQATSEDVARFMDQKQQERQNQYIAAQEQQARTEDLAAQDRSTLQTIGDTAAGFIATGLKIPTDTVGFAASVLAESARTAPNTNSSFLGPNALTENADGGVRLSSPEEQAAATEQQAQERANSTNVFDAAAGGAYAVSGGIDAVRDYLQSDEWLAQEQVRAQQTKQRQDAAAQARLKNGEQDDLGAILRDEAALAWDSITELADQPVAMAQKTIEMLPYMLSIGAVGKKAAQAATRSAEATLKGAVPQTPLKQIMEIARSSKDVAITRANEIAARRGAQESIERAGQLAATRAAAVGTGVIEGGSNASQFYQQVSDTPFEVLEQVSDRFNELVTNGTSKEDAREIIAQGGAARVGAISGAFSGLVGRLGGVNADLGLFDRASGNIAGRVAVAAAGEAVEEGLQSAGGTLASNLVTQETVNRDQAITEGLGSAVGEGALLGATSGGGTTAASQGAQSLLEASNAALEKASNVNLAPSEEKRAERAERRAVRNAAKEAARLQREVAALTGDTEETLAPAVRKEVNDMRAVSDANAFQVEIFKEIKEAQELQGDTKGAEETQAKIDALQNNREKVDRRMPTEPEIVKAAPVNEETLKEAIESNRAEDAYDAVLDQLDFSSRNNENHEEILTAAEALVNGSTTLSDDQKANITAVINAQKSSADVSDNILGSGQEWRGAGTYLGNITRGLSRGLTSTVAYNLRELTRFNSYISNKADAFNTAYEISQQTGERVTPINQETGKAYTSLDGGDMWVDAAIGESAQLVNQVRDDATKLAQFNTQANNMVANSSGAMQQAVQSLTSAMPVIAPAFPIDSPTTADIAAPEPETQEVSQEEGGAAPTEVTGETAQAEPEAPATTARTREEINADLERSLANREFTAAQQYLTELEAAYAPEPVQEDTGPDSQPQEEQTDAETPSTEQETDTSANESTSDAAPEGETTTDTITDPTVDDARTVAKNKADSPYVSLAIDAVARQFEQSGSIDITKLNDTYITPQAYTLAERLFTDAYTGFLQRGDDKSMAQKHIESVPASFGYTTKNKSYTEEDIKHKDTNFFTYLSSSNTSVIGSQLNAVGEFFAGLSQDANYTTKVQAAVGALSPVYANLRALTEQLAINGNKKNTRGYDEKVPRYPALNGFNTSAPTQSTSYLAAFAGPDGSIPSFIYDAVSAASMSWIGMNGRDTLITDRARLAALGNYKDEDSVDASFAAYINEQGGAGITRDTMINSLGDAIFRSLGYRVANKDLPQNEELKMKAALGTLALNSMLASDNPIVTKTELNVNEMAEAGANYSVDENNPNAVITTYRINTDYNQNNLDSDGLLDASGAIAREMGKALDVRMDKERASIGAPRRSSSKIKRMPHKKLGKRAVRNQNKQGQYARYLSRAAYNFMDVMGKELTMKAWGLKNYDPLTTLDTTAASIDGRNESVKQAWDNMQSFLDELVEVSEINGAVAFDTPFFQTYNASAYQRLTMASSSINEQAHKSSHRFMSHTGEVDMSIGDPAQEALLYIAVAQGLGIGVDKLSPETAIASVKAKLAGDYAQLVDIADNVAQSKETSFADLNTLAEYLGDGHGMHAFAALSELGAYRRAVSNGDTTFGVTIPLELDGLNNGPITAILQSLDSSVDTDTIIDRFTKAGIVSAENDMRTHATRKEEDDLKDLYVEGTAVTANALRDAMQSDNLNDTQPLQAGVNLKNLTVSAADSEARPLIDMGTGDIERDELKGIITKMFYGSGVLGLVRSEVNDMVTGLEAGLGAILSSGNAVDITTDTLLNDDQVAQVASLMSTMSYAMTDTVFAETQNGPMYKFDNVIKKERQKNYTKLMNQVSKNGVITYGSLTGFRFGREQYDMLVAAQSREGRYPTLKVKAVRENFTEAVTQAEQMIAAANSAFYIAKSEYNNLKERRRKELGMSQFSDFSTEQKNEMLAEMDKLFPNVSLAMHEDKTGMSDAIPLYNMEKASTSSTALYSIDGNQTGNVEVLEPTNVGAGAVAASTIPVADASSILGIFQRINQGVVSVYDGVLINAMNVDTLGQIANQSYLESLSKNDTLERHAEYMGKAVEVMGRDPYQELNITDSEWLDFIRASGALKDMGPPSHETGPNAYSDWVKSLTSVRKGGTVEASVKEEGVRLDTSIGLAQLQDSAFSALTGQHSTLLSGSASLAKNDTLSSMGQLNVGQFGSVSGNAYAMDINGKPAKPVANKDGLQGAQAHALLKEDMDYSVTRYNLKGLDPVTDTNMEAYIGRNFTEANLERTASSSKAAIKRRLTGLLGSMKTIDKGSSRHQFYSMLIDRVLAPAFTRSKLAMPTIVVETAEEGLARNNAYRKAKGKELMTDYRSRGQYVGKENAIYLNSDLSGTNAETVFHELVHAALGRAMYWAGTNDTDLLKSLQNLATEMADDNVLPRHIAAQFTGSNNADEALAWVLSNFDLATHFAKKDSPIVTDARKASTIRGYLAQVIKGIRKAFNKVFGLNAVATDSATAYLFETAESLARGTVEESIVDTAYAESRQLKMSHLQANTGYSVILNQTVSEDTQALGPIETFNSLLRYSPRLSEGFANKLKSTFDNEILPVLASVSYPFPEATTSPAERYLELVNNGGLDPTVPNLYSTFPMTSAEMYALESYTKVLEYAVRDSNINTTELAKLYSRAKKRLKPKDFLPEGITENDPTYQTEMDLAQKQYDTVFNASHLTSRTEQKRDAVGNEVERSRSDYLAHFGALARTNEHFARVLEVSLGDVSDSAVEADTFTEKMRAIVAKAFDAVLGTVTGTRPNAYARANVERLTRNLAGIEQKTKAGMVTHIFNNAYGKGEKIYSKYNQVAERLTEKATKSALSAYAKKSGARLVQEMSNRYRRSPKATAAMDELYYVTHNGYLSYMGTFAEELINTNDRNRELRALSMTKNKIIAGARDAAIKGTRRAILDGFTNLSVKDSEAITRVLLSTDAGSLTDAGYTLENIGKLIASPDGLVKAQEANINRVKQLAPTVHNAVTRGAKAMGRYMASGEVTEVATFTNVEQLITSIEKNFDTTLAPEVRVRIDAIATMEAIKYTNNVDKERVAKLFNTEAKGVAGVIKLHEVQKQNLRNSVENRSGAYQMPTKGYVTELLDMNRDVKTVPASQVGKHKAMGYRIHRKLEKAKGDNTPEVRYIMYSNAPALAQYQQGVKSTINESLSGLNNLDGRTISKIYGVDDYSQDEAVATTLAQETVDGLLDMNQPRKRAAVPINGVIQDGYNYAYSIPHREMDQLMGRDRRVEEVLPAMFGRTIEADGSEQHNRRVNEAIFNTFEQDRDNNRLSDYIEISANAPTKRGREAYRMMPPAARKQLREVWGNDIAYVRESLMDTVYGYRKLSIVDVIRKNDHAPKWTRSVVAPMANIFLGGKKYSVGNARRIEQIAQEVTSFVKGLIVVRGMEVLIGNLTSNTIQLVLEGDMSIKNAVGYQIEGFRAARLYQKNQSRIKTLEYLVQIEDDATELSRMNSELAELRDAQSKSNAAPLIEAGMLTAIVEDIEADPNPFSYTNRISAKVSGAVEGVPEWAKGVGGLALASKDSELYKALYMATQLGDFSARYAMYKNRQEKGLVDENTMSDVVDAFVNYDLPSNQYMQYLGDHGMMWFMKYFIRIQNVIVRNTYNNPRKALEFGAIASLLPIVGTGYFSAFFLFNAITNKLGFFDMAQSGIESLPVVQAAELVNN